MRVLDGNGIEEGEFKNFEMDLIIPSQYSGSLDYIEKFLNVDVTSFLQSSRDFVVQGMHMESSSERKQNNNEGEVTPTACE